MITKWTAFYNMGGKTELVGLTDAQTAAITSNVDPILLAEGIQLIRAEKEVSFRQAVKYHWRAILWSMCLSVALIMDGYDGAVVSARSLGPPQAQRCHV